MYSSIFILMSACSPLKQATQNLDRSVLNSGNITLLNGTYNRTSTPEDTSNMDDLLWIFFVLGQEPGDKVKLEITQNNRLKVTVLTKSKIERTKIYRGRIDNGQFIVKGITQFYPCLVFNLYRKRKIRLSVMRNGDLIVDSRISGFGLSLMLPVPFFFNEKTYDKVFKKI